MLSIGQVKKVYLEGIDIVFKRKAPHHNMKGEYCSDLYRINIYQSNIESRLDFDLTLLHEFIHASDDIRDRRLTRPCKKTVDDEAKRTYRKRPYIIKFIKELYSIG